MNRSGPVKHQFILIDATRIGQRLTGIERYTQDFCSSLSELLEHSDSEFEYVILLSKEGQDLIGTRIDSNRIIIRINPFGSQIATQQVWIPCMISKYRPKVAFFPAMPPSVAIALIYGTNVQMTIHDATMWKHVETTSWKNRVYFKWQTEFWLSRAQKIHTVSKASKSDITQVFPSIKDRLKATGEGVDIDKFMQRSALRTTRFGKMPGWKDRYILMVGTFEPRKNMTYALDVFERVADQIDDVGFVLAGRKGWGFSEIQEKVSRMRHKNHVFFVHDASDDELVDLYQHSRCLVLPSLYEGFGLPVIEAMAAGCPVICSDRGSLPEVASDAAIVLPLDQISDWVDALGRMINDEVARNRVIESGIRRANDFTWRKVAMTICRELESDI